MLTWQAVDRGILFIIYIVRKLLGAFVAIAGAVVVYALLIMLLTTWVKFTWTLVCWTWNL